MSPGTATGRPLAGRFVLLLAYSAGVAGYLLRRRSGPNARPLPETVAAGDIALAGVATHKLARMVAKEKVTAPLREPFTEPAAEPALPAEEAERPTRTGSSLRQGIGELISCPYCLDVWIGTGFAAGFVEAPRKTRFLATTLTVITISDLLQIAHRRAAGPSR